MSQITPDTKDAKLRKGNNNPKLLTRIISKSESCYNRLKSEVRKKKMESLLRVQGSISNACSGKLETCVEHVSREKGFSQQN